MPNNILENISDVELQLKPWQRSIQRVIQKTDTPLGKLFDILLLILILFSILAIMLESVDSLRRAYQSEFLFIEFGITILFTIEYILRIISEAKPFKYIFSLLGIIDLLSILPTYLSFFIAGTKPITVIRALRFLRVFRILKLTNYMRGSETIMKALIASRHKIIVFIITVLTIVVILGSLMYVIEPREAGFTSIPRSIYWAIITITTVGYGDIAPVTALGQALASFIMLIGYAIIAVPTGIVSAEIVKNDRYTFKQYECPKCKQQGHAADAKFCYNCGGKLD
jgi:voltage-gated potassium channel